MELRQSGQWGLAFQKEYAWQGERCSENNKLVKSLSPQAPCMAHLDLLAAVLAPVFVIFPFHFFPLQWLSNLPSLLQASLKTTLSFYTFLVWILFFFHSCHLYSPDPLREHQVSFHFFTFRFLALFIPSPRLSLLFQRLFWAVTTGTSPKGDEGHVLHWMCKPINGWATRVVLEQLEINSFLKQILKPFRSDKTPDWISNLQRRSWGRQHLTQWKTRDSNKAEDMLGIT